MRDPELAAKSTGGEGGEGGGGGGDGSGGGGVGGGGGEAALLLVMDDVSTDTVVPRVLPTAAMVVGSLRAVDTSAATEASLVSTST